MSCSLGRNRHQEEAVSLGLQGQHAYTITKVASTLKVESKTNFHRFVKVVKLQSRRFRGAIPLIRYLLLICFLFILLIGLMMSSTAILDFKVPKLDLFH